MVSDIDQVPQVIRQLLNEQTDLGAIRVSKDAGLCDVRLQRWASVPDLEFWRLGLKRQYWQIHLTMRLRDLAYPGRSSLQSTRSFFLMSFVQGAHSAARPAAA